jgi:hypothetical protein
MLWREKKGEESEERERESGERQRHNGTMTCEGPLPTG